MAQTPPPRPDDIAWIQQTALLDVTLGTIARKAAEMQADLRNGEIDIAKADHLGRAMLTALRQAGALIERVENAAKAAA
jgi:hypothetical protein